MRIKSFILTFVLTLSLVTALLVGCAPKSTPAPMTPTPTTKPPSDIVATASIVDNGAAFQKAIGRVGGTWIIAILKDLTIDKDLILEGEYKNGKKDANGKDVIQRKIALYAQDNQRNVTARYTLTAPKLTIMSPETGIWYGTFKGDVYVSAKDFQLIGAKIDGNIYFTTAEAQSTFKKDTASSVTGKTELKK